MLDSLIECLVLQDMIDDAGGHFRGCGLDLDESIVRLDYITLIKKATLSTKFGDRVAFMLQLLLARNHFSDETRTFHCFFSNGYMFLD